MLKLKPLSLSVLPLAALCAVLPLAAEEIRLASGGKTDYTVVAPEKPTADDPVCRCPGRTRRPSS